MQVNGRPTDVSAPFSGEADVTATNVPAFESDWLQLQAFESEESQNADGNVISSRFARNTNNPCIKEFVARIFYSDVFLIPICKKGCIPKVKLVSFDNGKSQGIVYDCTK